MSWFPAAQSGALGALLVTLACSTRSPVLTAPLFGEPTSATGLHGAQCHAAGAQPINPHELRRWQDSAALSPLGADPYEEPGPYKPDLDGVCAVVVEAPRRYHVRWFATAEGATGAGAIPTHQGRCGRCSSLQDLAVYASHPDLAADVRRCAVRTLLGPKEALTTCLEDLGFTSACAQIWAYNAQHTRRTCFRKCWPFKAHYHRRDGSLNRCLQCDEDQSGPVFQAIAGRTRRNSGVPTSICRPWDQVWLPPPYLLNTNR